MSSCFLILSDKFCLILRDKTSWNFLGATWAPSIKILGDNNKINEPTMTNGLILVAKMRKQFSPLY